MIVSDRYFSSIRGLSQLDKTDRISSILGYLERPLEVSLRNRFLYDAVKLLERDKWDAQEDIADWSFEKIGSLASAVDKLRGQLPDGELFVKLKNNIKQAIDTTFTDFDAFKQENKATVFQSVDKFVDWYYQNLPYATLALDSKHPWNTTAKERLEWMLSKSPEVLSTQTVELLLDYGQKFILEWFFSLRGRFQ